MTDLSFTDSVPPAGKALEEVLGAVESALAALGEALRARDLDSIDSHACALHRSLARAVDHFSHAARTGGAPVALRRRLVSASGLVAAQRESLARATAALDRAIDVLLPAPTGTLYSHDGAAERSRGAGLIRA